MLFIEQTGNTFLSFKFFFVLVLNKNLWSTFMTFTKLNMQYIRYSFTTQIRCEMTIVPNMVEKI